MIKKSIAAILVASSISCTAPKIKPQLRVVWSQQFQTCFCQMYSIDNIQPLEELYECDTSYCEDIVGFDKDVWASELTPWGKELKRWGVDKCKK